MRCPVDALKDELNLFPRFIPSFDIHAEEESAAVPTLSML